MAGRVKMGCASTHHIIKINYSASARVILTLIVVKTAVKQLWLYCQTPTSPTYLSGLTKIKI